MRLFTYLLKEILIVFITILAILVVILLANQFMLWVASASEGHISLVSVMKIMSLQLPILVSYLLPLAFFLSILLAYSRLHMNNEFIVLFAGGLSKLRLYSYTMLMGLVISIVVAIAMLWIVPQVQWYRKLIVLNAHGHFSIDKITPRHFQDIGQGVVLYSQHQNENTKQLNDVFVARFNQNENLWQLLRATSAHEITKNNSHYIVFDNGARFDVANVRGKYQQTHFNNYGYRMILPSYDLHSYLQVMPTSQLIHKIANSPKASAELQWRIALPISVLILTLIAVPFSSVKPRFKRMSQIYPALLFYMLYVNMFFLAKSWIDQAKFSPQWGFWWIHICAFIVAGIFVFYDFGVKNIFKRSRGLKHDS